MSWIGSFYQIIYPDVEWWNDVMSHNGVQWTWYIHQQFPTSQIAHLVIVTIIPFKESYAPDRSEYSLRIEIKNAAKNAAKPSLSWNHQIDILWRARGTAFIRATSGLSKTEKHLNTQWCHQGYHGLEYRLVQRSLHQDGTAHWQNICK